MANPGTIKLVITDANFMVQRNREFQNPRK